MHGVRESLLDAQIAALGLPSIKVPIPNPCPNAVYEARMAEACARVKAAGATHMVFGDLFLEDIRSYREGRLAEAGLTGIYPLWRRPTDALARAMIADGFVAHLACVDPKRLDAGFAGRRFDDALLDALPAGIDPCGENGEFHTVVTGGPIFAREIKVTPGVVSTRNGFVYADFAPVRFRSR
jgi:diphthamide synthase (EF-2-diphthine--ammonia ligase)